MKEIEELFRKLRHHYRLFLKGSNDSFIKMNEIETALLAKFRELEDYKAAFIVLWDFCKEQTHKQIELVKRAEQAEEQVENAKKDKDEAVKSVRIQYDSVCDMFHKREREYEDRITDLNNALINQLETGKQKTIYINQLEKENERLKNPIIESLHYDQNGLDIWASHPIIKVLAEETVRLLKLSNAENFVVVSLDDKERNGYTLTIKKNNGKSIEEKYEEVSKEVENLKCCANCFNLARTKNCTTDNWHENPRKSCDNWIFDGYKK